MALTILDLPTELLDHVFSYLDWDRKESLFPIKPDILSAGFVCKHFRAVSIPLIFKDVVLRLRWQEGALVEPCLFRLRREYPELAKHIRRVFIRTEFEQCAHCAAKGNPSAFTVPPEIGDWTIPSNGLDENDLNRAAFRSRADAIAQRIWPSLADTGEAKTSAEGIVRVARDSSQYSVKADALSIVMLCVPASTHTVIFQSLPDDSLHETRNEFALRVVSTTVELLGSNLKDLTLVSTSAIGISHRANRRRNGLPTHTEDSPLLSPDVIKSLTINRLTLALTDHVGFSGHRTQLSHPGVSLWHGASDWIRELTIRNTSSEFNETLRCIKGFQSLKTIRFQESALHLPQPPIIMGQNGRQRAEVQQNVWLLFVIEVRQVMQHVAIELDKVYTWPTQTHLSDSALHWILNEAVPTGVLIDADRHERLLTDFDSFLPLWDAEDGERGTQALESWEKQRSILCDGAMSRRWR